MSSSIWGGRLKHRQACLCHTNKNAGQRPAFGWIDSIALRACLLPCGTLCRRLLVERRAELLLVQRGFRGIGEGGEGGGVADGDVGQDLPVDQRTGGLQA